MYLNDLDQKFKNYNYIRYVDDFLVVGNNPTYYLNIIKAELQKINLILAPNKTIINPTIHGIDFVGAEIKPFRKSIRTKTKIYATNKLLKYPDQKSFTSYIAISKSNGNYKDILHFSRLALKHNYPIVLRFNKVPLVKTSKTINKR